MEPFERYHKNVEAFSIEEVQSIRQKRVCVVGCGGLGGHVIQSLARFGVGFLTLVDGDVFCASNLNRQAFCTETNLGQSKANAAKEALATINSDVIVHAHFEMLTEQNAEALLSGHDLAIDCLDNVSSRFILMQACNKANIPFVHGAIGGFFGQVANVFPGDDTLNRLYPSDHLFEKGIENRLGNPPFTPQLVAALQCSEALKILAGRDHVLRNAVLHIDLLHNEFEKIALC